MYSYQHLWTLENEMRNQKKVNALGHLSGQHQPSPLPHQKVNKGFFFFFFLVHLVIPASSPPSVSCHMLQLLIILHHSFSFCLGRLCVSWHDFYNKHLLYCLYRSLAKVPCVSSVLLPCLHISHAVAFKYLLHFSLPCFWQVNGKRMTAKLMGTN